MTRAAMMATTRYGRAMSQYPPQRRAVPPMPAQHQPQPHAWAPPAPLPGGGVSRPSRRRSLGWVWGVVAGVGAIVLVAVITQGNPEVARATADLRASWSGLVDAFLASPLTGLIPSLARA